MQSVAFATSGKHLFSISEDRTLRAWLKRPLEGEPGVRFLSFRVFVIWRSVGQRRIVIVRGGRNKEDRRESWGEGETDFDLIWGGEIVH